ncbi:hypothetical protein JD844_026834, partial [Phrynosoma platyrhinos]
ISMILVWRLWIISVAGAVSLSAQENCLLEPATHLWNCSSKAFSAIPSGLTGDVLGLDLAFNRIKQVREADLKFAINLRMLLLQSNLIQTIEEDAFHTLVKLEHLDLSRNKLTCLLPSWFASLSSLQKLNIKGNYYSELGENPLFSGLKSLKFLYLGNDAHFPTLRRQDLEGISILEELEIEGPNLNQYEPGSLQSMELINHLILNDPSTTSFPLLMNDVRTSVMCLELRNIPKLSHPCFQSLYAVTAQKFVLRNVEISDRFAVHISPIVASMSQLHELELADCRFQGIGDFSGIQKFSHTLQVIIIRNLSIKTFYSVSDLSTIMSLVGGITSLTLENSNAFLVVCPVAASFHSLQYLDLSVNLFRDDYLEHTLCQSAWPKLQTLNISQNFLKKIEIVSRSAAHMIIMIPVWKLWFISVAGAMSLSAQEDCRFEAATHFWNCSSKAFSAIPSGLTGDVLGLDLAFNRIKQVREADLKFAVNLRMLLLQSNLIQTIEEDAFHTLVKLEHLDLSRNKLTCMSPSWFASLSSLQKLNIKGNYYLELGETPLFSGLKSLKFLYLGNEAHFSTLRGQDLEGISILEELEIEGPNLKQYEPGSLQSMELINHLILNNPSVTSLLLLLYDIRNSVVFLELQNIQNITFFLSLGQEVAMATQKLVLRNIAFTDSSVAPILHFLGNMDQLQETQFLDCKLLGTGHFGNIQNISSPLHVVTIKNISIDAFYAFSDLSSLIDLLDNITSITVENANVYLVPCLVGKHFHSLLYLDLTDNLLIDLALDHSLCQGAWPKLQTLNVSQNSLKQLEIVSQSAARMNNDSAILILLEPIPAETVPKRFCKLRKLMNTKTYLEWPGDEDQQPLFWFNLKTAIKL